MGYGKKWSWRIMVVALLLQAPHRASAVGPQQIEAHGNISNQHINAFCQDKTGYMWIGTAKGLSRFNGYEYTHYYYAAGSIRSVPADFITALYLDISQTLWVATNNGVCRYNDDTDDFSPVKYEDLSVNSFSENGFFEFHDQLYVYGMNGIKRVDTENLTLEIIAPTADFYVQTVIRDDYNQIWFADRINREIYCLDRNLTELDSIPLVPPLEIYCSYKTDKGELWFGSNQGIVGLDPLQKKQVPLVVGGGNAALFSRFHVSFFHRLDDRKLVIGTENKGLYIYDSLLDVLEPASFFDVFVSNESLHTTCCYADRNGDLWLGTFDRGYRIEYTRPRRFNSDRIFNSFFDGKFVTRIEEDDALNLWIGTRYHGLVFYDQGKRETTVYDNNNFPPFIRANSNFIQSLFRDSRGNLWVGFNKYLLWCEVSGKTIRSYRLFDIKSDIVTITEDDAGRVWTGSASDGISIYDIHFRQPPVRLPLENRWNNITKILKLRSGEMLFSVFEKGIYLTEPHTLETTPFVLPPEVRKFGERTIFLYEDPQSELWIGTYGFGLLRYQRSTNRYTAFHPGNGLPSNDILAMIDDFQGKFWISTSYGISNYDPKENRFTNYFDTDGIGGNQFHEKSILRSRNGKIYFGGNHGITYFNPKEIVTDTRVIPVVLEDLKIMNESVRPESKKGVLRQHISQTQAITLNHTQDVFSIDYTGLDFNTSRKINYAYRLRDFDKEWNYVGGFRRASYSNLSPGKYLFEVRAQNPDGTWNDTPTTLAIRIKPAPWLSTWAVLGYILLFLLLFYLCVRVYIRIRLDKERIALIEKERVQENEMNELKIRFYNNISHELRTPLTMICGPVKKLMEKRNDPELESYLLRLVDYNVESLLRLIDQLMDLGKLESETLSLSVSEQDAVPLVQELITAYSFYAREKNIRVSFTPHSEQVPGWFDADKLRKIVGNLLSNALKYTPEGGHVLIDLEITDQVPKKLKPAFSSVRYLSLKVIDDGIGMNPEDMVHLFQRHKRFGKNDRYAKNVPGKGIGLHYVRQLVEKHKGNITGESGNEKGMVFSLILPVGREAYREDELTAPPEETALAEDHDNKIFSQGSPEADSPADPDLPPEARNVLVVEDNEELREFVKRMLRENFRVYTAANGAEGLRICRKESIDLVVSDVVMPETDGFELCRIVKNDPELCHIPVLLLTAKSMEEDQIQGYRYGADGYIKKPFNPVLLQTIIENIFSNQQRKQHGIFGKLSSPDISGPPEAGTAVEARSELNPLDQKFMEKLYGCIDRDISDTELSVHSLGKELGFSRTSLYRKIKALTGQSPNDFLRLYRLNRAAELILKNEYSVNEIVDMTGFASHSYFSSCFKKVFGVNPRDYKYNGLSTKE